MRRRLSARAAAPEGGARTCWVRGCVISLCLTATAAFAQDVPSGQSVTLHEVLVDSVNGEDWLRYRFVAPQIGRDTGDVSYAAAEPDFAYLCETVALPNLAEFDLSPDIVVITLMDRFVPFGQADAKATQYIEAFRVTDGTCIWEAF